MNLVCERLSNVAEADRARWLDEFSSCAAGLRGDEYASHAPSRGYDELILTLAGARPSDVLMVRHDNRVVARGLVAAAAGRPGAATIGLFEASGAGADSLAGPLFIRDAHGWARGAGFTEIFAPVDLNTWFTYRFLLPSTPEPAPPVYGWEPAQPPAYMEIFATAGYREAERYQTIGAELDDRIYGAAAAARTTESAFSGARDAGYVFHRLDQPAQLDPLLVEMHPVCMDAFSDNLLFEPIPLEVFRAVLLQTAARYDCSLSHWVRDPEGALTGFVLAFIDDGAVVVKTIAVAGAARGKRLSSALMHLVLRESAARQYRRFVSALVRSGNTSGFLSQVHVVPGVTPWRREYVLLHRELGQP